MPLRLRPALLLVLLAFSPVPSLAGPPPAPNLQPRFFALLHAGDSVYARKDSYADFTQALAYYDRAQRLADRSHDTLLLAEAVFARGRVYDAWNREPYKTVAYFRQAAALFARLPRQWRRYYYARYLVAHAYDKVPDSLGTVRELRRLRRELAAQPPAVLRQVPLTVEMALTATQVRNYPLADSLLQQLTRRAWIRNDPDTYDYLTHYYLTRARLNVYYYHRRELPYLDSLSRAARQAASLLDRVYYAQNLAELNAGAGRYRAAYASLIAARQRQDSLDAGSDAATLRRALLQSEERAALTQRSYEEARRQQRNGLLGGLSGGLLIISLLSFYLYRQGRHSQAQAQSLRATNAALDEKISQVELLNKEIQHRVKNNLHMVFSLLQMQERRSDNDEVVENLQAARLRVESIAALHNQLLTQAAPGLDIGTYLQRLVMAAVDCLATDKQVVTHIVSDALPLAERQYLPLSLVLNEWVTNSIKYAEPAGGPLELRMSVKTVAGESWVHYADNGQSRPGTPGLGSQLVALLTRQLGGTLRVSPAHPYRYELRFPTNPEPVSAS